MENNSSCSLSRVFVEQVRDGSHILAPPLEDKYIKAVSQPKVLTGDDISFEQWLAFMKDRPKDVQFEDYMFPS